MKSLAHALSIAASFSLLGGLGLACGSNGAASSFSSLGGGSAETCMPSQTESCACPSGGDDAGDAAGTKTCAPDGSGWGLCVCPVVDAGPPDSTTCGDGICGATESCVECPADCGICPACAFAPSCTGASSVPASPTAATSFDNAGQTSYSSGVGFDTANAAELTVCSYPELKMRLSQIVVHKNGAPGSLQMFCVVQADDGASSQIVVTPEFTNLSDNNPAIAIAPSAGTFWGQAINGVKLSQFNITVTYQCYMVTQPTALQNALNAIATAAGSAAAIPGNPYGWAFSVGGAAAAAAEAAVAVGNGATPLLNVEQTIDETALLKLTNGYSWKVEETGSTKVDGDCDVVESCSWDWELDVEAWGCATVHGGTPM